MIEQILQLLQHIGYDRNGNIDYLRLTLPTLALG